MMVDERFRRETMTHLDYGVFPTENVFFQLIPFPCLPETCQKMAPLRLQVVLLSLKFGILLHSDRLVYWRDMQVRLTPSESHVMDAMRSPALMTARLRFGTY